jgi:hypothetical protein
MEEAERFPFVMVNPDLGPSHALPYMPIVLEYRQRQITVIGLVDSGSTLNVLPYGLGLELGLVWDKQSISVPLTGNLKDSEASAIILMGRVGGFAPVRLAFAWTRNERVPLILGQANFFMEFDVCLFRSRWAFEVRPKSMQG